MKAGTNPIDGFVVDRSSISYVGDALQRPECILAERDGSLWTADARGGVVHIRPDGSQRLVSQSVEQTDKRHDDSVDRFVTGTLPNGLAFARNGDILIANFGTDRLEVMSRAGETRVLVDQIEGEPIGKVNFVLRDSKDRLWLTISTRIKNWMSAISPAVADGFIAVYDGKSLGVVADGFRFTNEIRFDAREEWLYVAETCGRCVTRLRALDNAVWLTGKFSVHRIMGLYRRNRLRLAWQLMGSARLYGSGFCADPTGRFEDHSGR
jgi:sugar lactone lactonase YvrE